MSYNPRMSMVPSSQQQNRGGKKKEEDSDAFMRLVLPLHHIPPKNDANSYSPTKKLLAASVI